MSIPKIIHSLWVQGIPVPDRIAYYIETWRHHHPGYEHRFWHEANMITLHNQDLWDRAGAISPKAPQQFRSDVARYEILSAFGGVWVDADTECLKPIDDLLGVEAFAGRVAGRWLNNAVIGATPSHSLMDELVSRLATNVERFLPIQGNTLKSGPQYFTPIARRHRITEYPERFFYPYYLTDLGGIDRDHPHSYAVHHWANTRRLAGQPL